MQSIYSLYSQNNKQIRKQIGEAIQRKRINSYLTQGVLAERAGVSLYTVTGLENGRNFSIDTLLSVLRELNQLELLTRLMEPEPVAPDVLHKAAKSQRIRVRNPKNKKS